MTSLVLTCARHLAATSMTSLLPSVGLRGQDLTRNGKMTPSEWGQEWLTLLAVTLVVMGVVTAHIDWR